MKYFILFLLLTTYLYADSKCSSPLFMQDLTDESMSAMRQSVFDNQNNPGFRVGWNNVKAKNKIYGLGGVNEVMCQYESRVKETFDSDVFKKAHPDVKVEFYKTDFKGYYLNCSPKGSCEDIVSKGLKSIAPPKFPDEEILSNTVVRSNNYQEGYIKSRMAGLYDVDIDNVNLSQFVDQEMKAAIKEATGSTDLSQLSGDDKAFMRKLAKNIDEFRNYGIDNVDPKFKRLVQGLDTLLEIPYSNSNNIEMDLKRAIESGEKISHNNNLKLSYAQSGDDMFIIIKDGDKVVKIVGADAKGLGVENMTARYSEFLNQAKKGPITSMQDITDLSMEAIKRADTRMDKSFERYLKVVKQEIVSQGAGANDLDEALNRAHLSYSQMTRTDQYNMVIRSGAISNDCLDNKCIMNRITVIHNNLKTMEAAGINNHFGTSCLSTEYWLLKMGLKSAK